MMCQTRTRDCPPAHPHGLSNGSLAPNALFVVLAGAGAVEADAHPPKSSSAATMGWAVLLLAGPEMGAPQPPEMSSGVILLGTLPSSTLGAAGFDCTGAAQASVSVLPHGFSTGFPAEFSSGRVGAKDGLGIGAEVVGEERLNGELNVADGLANAGEGIAAVLDGTACFGGEAAAANPPKASSLNRSAGSVFEVGFDTGGDVVVGCVANEKSSRAEDVGAADDLVAGGFVVVDEKKSPPLSGGGEVI